MVIVLLVFPIVVCLSMTVVAGVLGWFVKDDVVDAYPPDSEYVELGQ